MSNDTQTMTLAEFLTARIAEDEAVARAAIEDDCGEDGGFEDAYESLTRAERPLDHIPGFGEAAASLIVRTAVPRRVLAECEAKRRIVEQLERNVRDVPQGWIDRLLQQLAAVYADHEDYNPDWRP